MRVDHIAYRVKSRKKAAEFFQKALGYEVAEEFEVSFEDGSTAKCMAMEPPEKIQCMPHIFIHAGVWNLHTAPEIFVSDGTEGSIVNKWVEERGGIGGVHHIAYQVDSVEETMQEWIDKGYAEFTTKKPLTCPGLTQCFTKPSEITGVVYELIKRDSYSNGFCKDNVKDLMESTE